jgi:hypothetical protein
MKIARLTFALVIGITVVSVNKIEAQSSDRAPIGLSHPVTVGTKTLQPGNYSIEQLSIAGGDSPVLVIRGDNGMRVQTAVMIAPSVENRVQPDTRVVFYRIGHDYYLDRIWVKGWTYGYKFALPKGVKGSEKAVEVE